MKKLTVLLIVFTLITSSAFAYYIITPDVSEESFTLYDSSSDEELVVDNYVYMKSLGPMRIDQLAKGIWRLTDLRYPTYTNFVLINAAQVDADFYIKSDRNSYMKNNILSYNTNISDSVLTSFSPLAYYATYWTTKVYNKYNASSTVDAKKIKADTQVKIENGRFSILYPAMEAPSYPNSNKVQLGITCPHCGYWFTRTFNF